MTKVVTGAYVNLVGGALPAIDGGKPGTNGGPTKFINANTQMSGTDRPVPTGKNCVFIGANGDMQKL